MIALVILLGGVWLLALLGGATPAKWILGLALLAEVVNNPDLTVGALNLLKKGAHL